MNSEEVKEKMRRRRYRQKLISFSLIPASVLLTFLCFLLNAGVLLLVGGALALGWVAFTMLNWRCPSCHGLLAITSGETTCEKCGTEIGIPGKTSDCC